MERMDKARARRMNEAISQIIIDRRFSVAKQGQDLQLIKMIGKRPVTIFLRRELTGFVIEPPKYDFRSSNSHFEFTMLEKRCTRRKGILLGLVEHLQKTKMWDFVLNKDFFTPNQNNPKMNKKVVGDQYYSVVGIKVT
jgi:hypothetical protein